MGCDRVGSANQDYLDRIMAARDVDPADEALDTDDVFQDDPAAPQWVRDWQGPFTIRIRVAG